MTTTSQTSYTLTGAEAAEYDSGDDRRAHALMRDLHRRFGRGVSHLSGGEVTEVYHPDGFVVCMLAHDAA